MRNLSQLIVRRSSSIGHFVERYDVNGTFFGGGSTRRLQFVAPFPFLCFETSAAFHCFVKTLVAVISDEETETGTEQLTTQIRRPDGCQHKDRAGHCKLRIATIFCRRIDHMRKAPSSPAVATMSSSVGCTARPHCSPAMLSYMRIHMHMSIYLSNGSAAWQRHQLR